MIERGLFHSCKARNQRCAAWLEAAAGASRSPGREALRMLAAEGLVTLVANSGAWVARMSLAECDEAYLVRERLEPLLLRVLQATNWQERQGHLSRVYKKVVRLHNALGVTALQKAEIATWWPIIKASNIKGD